jgi:hypothetical protein
MRRPRRLVPQRRRVFLGCEGESEQSYGALLARLVEARHRQLFLDAVLLRPGGGDPLALVERAVREVQQRSDRRGGYVARAVLLDSDRRGAAPERDAQALALAARHALRLIWQEPCHEAFLLRHLEGHARARPPDARRALADLARHWPEYRKGLPAAGLASRVDEAGVLRAARVEAELAAFLAEIAFAAG